MTALQLLAWIATALGIQLVVGGAVAAWRSRGAGSTVLAQPTAAPSADPSAAWPGWREFRVVRKVLEDPDGTQCSFYLEPSDGAALPAFRPGQFLTFSLALPGRTITRCYSLSDRPHPAHYRITVKRVPSPAGHPEWPPGESSSHFHDQVQVGTRLQVKAPSGRFHIDQEAGVPAVLIGGGIGITPMISMLNWCLAEQPGRAIHLYHGLRHSGEHAFKAAVEALAATHPQLHLQVAYSRPRAADRAGLDFQHAGHVDIDLLRRTLPHGRHLFYICGPASMMDSLVPALQAWGVPPQDIRFEAFGPATARLAAPMPGRAEAPHAEPVEIHFRRSGRTLVWDGQDANLLDFAERHGVEVDSGCRSGGCGSCETAVVSGAVDYAHTPDHALAPARCLLCVGRPAGPLVLEA